jgi:threonine aldolase
MLVEAALFFPSGTQSTLAALMSHCGRGEEVILGSDLNAFPHVKRWYDTVGARPAVAKGMAVPTPP